MSPWTRYIQPSPMESPAPPLYRWRHGNANTLGSQEKSTVAGGYSLTSTPAHSGNPSGNHHPQPETSPGVIRGTFLMEVFWGDLPLLREHPKENSLFLLGQACDPSFSQHPPRMTEGSERKISRFLSGIAELPTPATPQPAQPLDSVVRDSKFPKCLRQYESDFISFHQKHPDWCKKPESKLGSVWWPSTSSF